MLEYPAGTECGSDPCLIGRPSIALDVVCKDAACEIPQRDGALWLCASSALLTASADVGMAGRGL